MKKIRIGNDIVIKWRVTINGEDVNLEGLDLALYISTTYQPRREIAFTVAGNEITATYKGTAQKVTGVYRLTLYRNEGENAQSILDACDAFELVSCSCLTVDAAFGSAEVELPIADLGIGVPGLSAYEIAVSEGFEGTQEEWLASLSAASEAAAAECRKFTDEAKISEKERQDKEALRVTAEDERAANETTRQSSEATRLTNERSRTTAEQQRVTNETARSNAESSRVTVETARQSAETARQAAEQGRATAEQQRADAEAARAEEFATFEGKIAAKEDAANKVTSLDNPSDVTFPTSKVVGNLAKKNSIAVFRGNVTYSDGNITVGKGIYYFYNQFGEEYSKFVSEDLEFTPSASTPYLVFNYTQYNFYIKAREEIKHDDIVCLFYDGVRGICGGQWYSYYKNNQQDDKIVKLSSFEKTQLIGLSSSVERDSIYTDYISVAPNDIVEWTSYITSTNISLWLYDSNKSVLDRWTAPSYTRQITISYESAAYVRVAFNQAELYNDQTVYVNGSLKAKYAAIKENSAGTAYFANASAEVNTETRVVTIKKGSDIYSSVRDKIRFYRFNSDYTFTLSDGGTSLVVYNNKTKELYCNGDSSLLGNDIYVIGVKYTHKLYLNGDIAITYSNGSKSKSLYTYNDIQTIAGLNILPSFVLENGRETYRRMMEWANGDSIYTLAQVTDVHSGGTQKYKVLEWLDSLNDLFGFNVIANFGDIGLDTSATNGDKAASFALIENTKRFMRNCNPWLFLKGNHEKLEEGIVSNNGMYGNIFNKSLSKNQFSNVVLSADGCYGYVDDGRTKTRFIFTNTSDTGYYYGFTNAQLQFVIDSIMSAADGFKIIVGGHYCLDDIGRWASYPDECVGSSAMKAILNSAANHTAGSADDKGLTWDFSGKTNVKLVCSLAGDSHFNNYVNRDGVNYIVRQGYGGVDASEMPVGATKDSFSWDQICNFDVLAVKNNGHAKMFRIGIGGELREFEFTY